MADRQRATAVYFIDRFALRVGNEKGEDEADTVGCCSLRYEHVTLKEPNLVTFDFLGKDSIRFYQPDKEVTIQVFKNLKLFKKSSEEGADLFDRINVRSSKCIESKDCTLLMTIYGRSPPFSTNSSGAT